MRSVASFAFEDALVAQARYYAARRRYPRIGRKRPTKEQRADVEAHRQVSQMAFGALGRVGGPPDKGTRDRTAALEVSRLRINGDARHRRCLCSAGCHKRWPVTP